MSQTSPREVTRSINGGRGEGGNGGWGGVGSGGASTRCPVMQLPQTTTPSPAYRLRRNIVVAVCTLVFSLLGAWLVYVGIGPLHNDIIVIVGFVLLGTGVAVLLLGISYSVRDKKMRRFIRTTDGSIRQPSRSSSSRGRNKHNKMMRTTSAPPLLAVSSSSAF